MKHLAILLLASCSAQANEPSLSFEQEGNVIHFVNMHCQTDEAECMKQCGDKFPTPDLDPYHEACLKAAAERFKVVGGEA